MSKAFIFLFSHLMYIFHRLFCRHLFPPPSPIFAGGANGSYVRGVSVCHDGRHVASVADDMYARFWDIYNPSSPVIVASINYALCCSYSPDGAVLAVGLV